MKYIVFVIGLLFSIPISSQKLNKDYSFLPQEDGVLYFVFPQKGFSSADNTAKKGLEYDLTYFTANDSILFSYTYTNRDICKTENISFLSEDGQTLYQGKAEMLFVQPKKKAWTHRATVKIPYNLIVSLYATQRPYDICLHTGKKDIHYTMNGRKWKKQSYRTSRIFDTIKYNQK